MEKNLKPEANFQTRLLIKKLEVISVQYLQLAGAIKTAAIQLADLGVVPHKFPPVVMPVDSMKVAKLKEQIIISAAKQKKISDNLTKLGVQLLNPSTFEIIMSGETPKDKTPPVFLSWQPGEKDFCFYRKHATLNSNRCVLKNKNKIQPTFH